MSDSEPTPGPSTPRKRNRLPDEVTFLSLPMKKRKRRDMGSNEKLTAINTYKYLEKIYPTYPVKKEIAKATAEIIGTSVQTVNRILREYKTTGKVMSPDRSKPKYQIVEKLDDYTLSAIRGKVQQFFLDNNHPTIDKVLKAVNDDEDLPSFKRSTMHKILVKLYFTFPKRSRKSAHRNVTDDTDSCSSEDTVQQGSFGT